MDDAASGALPPYEMEYELLAGPPRPVRYTRRSQILRRLVWNGLGMAMAALFLASRITEVDVAERQAAWFLIAFTVLLGGVSIGYALERHLRERRFLLEHGAVAEAWVVERQADTGIADTYELVYAYSLPNGRDFEGLLSVATAVYDAYPLGSCFTVLYDPADPTRHLTYFLLTEAKVAGATC
jgi:hypothetical protein